MLMAPEFIGPAGTHHCPFLLFYFLLVVVDTSVIALPMTRLSYSPARICSSFTSVEIVVFVPHLLIVLLEINLISRYLYALYFCPSEPLQLPLSFWWVAALMGLVTCCPNAWKLEFAWKTCLKEGSVFRLICKKKRSWSQIRHAPFFLWFPGAPYWWMCLKL